MSRNVSKWRELSRNVAARLRDIFFRPYFEDWFNAFCMISCCASNGGTDIAFRAIFLKKRFFLNFCWFLGYFRLHALKFRLSRAFPRTCFTHYFPASVRLRFVHDACCLVTETWCLVQGPSCPVLGSCLRCLGSFGIFRYLAFSGFSGT